MNASRSEALYIDHIYERIEEFAEEGCESFETHSARHVHPQLRDDWRGG
jgi:hypothetical protein